MSFPIVFRPVAQEEFDEAADWYDRQREGLGAEFIAEIEEVLEKIAENPNRYPVVLRDIHEGLVSRFPFCFYYRARSDLLVIIAVFHTSRNPEVWQGRS